MAPGTISASFPDVRERYWRLSRYLPQFLHYALKERRQDAHWLALIATSDHFDSHYYRSRYEDVAEAGVDPVMHYVDFGAHEQRNPSEQFNTAKYVKLNPVVAEGNLNPLIHYLRNGSPAASAVGHAAARVSSKPDSTQASPAPREQAPSAKAKAPPPRLSLIINHLKSLSDDDLVSTLQRIETSVVLPRAREHFKNKAWQKLKKLGQLVLNKRPDHQRLLLIFGRANLYAGNEEGASHLLSVATRLFPESAEAQLYCGVAHLRARTFDLAIAHFRSALKLDPANINAKRELGAALRQASRVAQANAESQAMASEASTLLVEVYRAQLGPATAMAAARMLYEQRRYEECNALLDEVAGEGTRLVEHLVLKSRALVGLNRIAEALAVSEQVLKLEPANQAASLLLRTCRFLAGEERSSAQTFGQVVFGLDGVVQYKAIHPEAGETEAATLRGSLEEVVAQLPYDWLQISAQPNQLVLEPGQEFIQRLANEIDPRAGFHRQGDIKLWRRSALVDLARSGLLQKEPTDLARLEPIHTSLPRPAFKGATAIVMSRNGSFKFGGGEHLLESMAEHYQSLGYAPLIVGTRPEFRGESGEVNGFRFTFVDDDIAALRRFFVEHDAHLVHAISGLGYQVAEALAHTNIPFIYGVHYWREVLGQEDEGFFDDAGKPIPRPEFHYILSRATTVYANSVFTRDIIEKTFGVRCPVVFSVPRDQEGAP